MTTSISDQLRLHLLALCDVQSDLDDRLITDLQQTVAQRHRFCLPNDTVVEIPHLLLTGIRSTAVTSARITINLQANAMRIIPQASSVAVSINTEDMPDLCEQLLNRTPSIGVDDPT